MTEEVLRVGLDACVFIEAVLFAGTTYPSARVLEAASRSGFEVLLVDQVDREVRRALGSTKHADAIQRYEALLLTCNVARVPDASESEFEHEKRAIWPFLRDEPDVRVAVALKWSDPKAHFFVSSNHHDWTPSSELSRALGGTRVASPKDFIKLLERPA